MRKLTVAIAALVVGASLVAAVPASGTDGGAAEPRERAAPELPEQWRHTYGGSGDDIFADLVRTDDGGYLLVGWTQSEDRDGWVVKTNADGEKQWERSLGGSGTDRFYGVARTADGYLLAGRTDRSGGPNGWVVELGPDGDVADERTPGPGAFYAVARDDSGYLLAGWTRGDGREGWATKLDRNGSEEWSRTYATPDGYDAGYLRAVVPTDDGYYLAGKIEGDSDDAWALSVGPDGGENWQATAGGSDRDDVWAAAPADEGFVLAGETESEATGPRDGWLVKFGADGSVEWERRHGGEGTQWIDSAMATDEGFLFTGSSDAESGGTVDGYVLATDPDGAVAWESYYGTDSWDKPWPAIRAHGGGYVLAGQTAGDGAAGKDGWLVRIGAPADGGTGDGTTAASGETTTDSAMQGDTATGTEESSSDVPGFGVVGALVALATLLAAVQRRRG
jgi:PGF-CTERM protein